MFQPSIHGWPFGNDFECSGPELGIGGPPPPELGMGGGLCWSALDRYLRGVSIPRDLEAPAPGDPLHAELYQRQVAAVAGQWPRVRDWQDQPDGSWRDRLPVSVPFGSDLASRTRREWRSVRKRLSRGEPVLLVLLPRTAGYERPRAVKQVLATAAAREGREAKLWIYDPDAPGDDRVRVSISLSGPLDGRTSNGTAIRGFFAVPYDRRADGVVRTESFDDRSVIGMNRSAKGDLSMAASRNRLDVVARDERGALLHFRRDRKRHWESTNVTEAEGFGTDELHADPVAVRTGGTLHVFGLSYVGDLIHFQLRRRWRVSNRTDHKRVGAQFRMAGRVVPVVGPRRISVIGRDEDGGLVHYEHRPLRGWRAEQVAGDPVAGTPSAMSDGTSLHVVGTDSHGRLLHWHRQEDWAMTDPDAGEGPTIRLAGEPRLRVRSGAVSVFGRTVDGELAILTLGFDGTWTRRTLARKLAGDPRVTDGPSGTHVFAPTRNGLIHVWRQQGDWVWENVMDTRPALLDGQPGHSELACWGSDQEILVFERRGSALRVLAWRPDADWVADPVSGRAGTRPILFRDHAGRPHVFFTDRWGTVLHVEKGAWREPGRPTLKVTSDAPRAATAGAGARTRTPDPAPATSSGGPAEGEPEPSEPTAPVPADEPVAEPVDDANAPQAEPTVADPAHHPEAEPVAAAGPEPEPEPEVQAEPEPVIEARPEPEPVAEAGPEPEPDPEPEPLPLLEGEDSDLAAELEAEPGRERDEEELPFLDFEEDEPPSAPLPYLESEAEAGAGAEGEELPLLDTENDAATPEPAERPASAERRVKGGPASPRRAVDVEPMDLSLLDTWPETGPGRRRKKRKEGKRPKNGGSPS